MTTEAVADVALHYRIQGSETGPVLLLSNSLGTSLDMWAAQEALASDFRLLRYDTRGHGSSAKPKGPYTIEQLGRDVLSLMDALEIQQAVFCGISMGGLIGQWLGIHAPDRFTHLVLCNTAAKIGSEQGWLDRAALVREYGMGTLADTAASRWFTAETIASRPAEVEALTEALRTSDAEGYAACCEALAKADLREAIRQIAIPTLVIAGREDPVTTTKDADFMAERIQGTKRVDLAASHLSNIEDSKAFNDALRSFLAS